MRHTLFIATFLLLAVLSSSQLTTEQINAVKSNDISNQIGNEWIIRFKDGVNMESKELMQAYLNTLKLPGTQSFGPNSKYFFVDDASSQDIDTFIESYYDDIDYITPNSYVKSSVSVSNVESNLNSENIDDADDDPDRRHDKFIRHNVDWALDRIDQIKLPLDGKFHHNYTGSGVNVYMFGDGVKKDHPEFSNARIVDEFSVNGLFGYFDGVSTGAASIVVGKNLGVAVDATFRVVKVTDNVGDVTVRSILEGLEHIAYNGKHPAVVEASYSIPSIQNSELVAREVRELIRLGFIVIWTAGRESTYACNFYPIPHISEAIIVGNTNLDETSRLDMYEKETNYGSCVDFYAPGERLRGAHVDPVVEYDYYHGFGSAIAAGYAAMILERNEDLFNNEVKAEMIRKSHALDRNQFHRDTNPRMIFTVNFSSGNALNMSFMLIAFMLMAYMMM